MTSIIAFFVGAILGGGICWKIAYHKASENAPAINIRRGKPPYVQYISGVEFPERRRHNV